LQLFDAAPWLGGKPTNEILNEAPGRHWAPVEPGKIVGVGSNYRAHAAEMGKPLPVEPLLFLKPPSSLLGPDAAIQRPPGYERTDFEGELGVVIGKRAQRVSVEDALSYVFGYTVVNDVTVRDLQKRDGQFTRAKGFDTFCPVGPCVVASTGSDGTVLDPSNLSLRTRLNGELKQDSSTADMVFDVPTLVSFISQVMTLEPGDLIATGTPPGVHPIAPGDRVEIEIDQLGILANPVTERGM
jgi:2-keto-4-pentenoate hydratase/2-oxohepta-3-ene-1,7-dioic acid hydratase in catechol pathway